MPFPLPGRRSIRLKGHDYSQPGAYFVTICTHTHAWLFGEVLDGEMRLNRIGLVTHRCWLDIPFHFPGVELDEFVIMPNHLHGIVIITDRDDAGGRDDVGDMGVGAKHSRMDEPVLPQTSIRECFAPTGERPNGTATASLSAIVQNFKSVSSRRVNQVRETAGGTIWQRNYYEHIVRNQESLDTIRQYIVENPAKWDGRSW